MPRTASAPRKSNGKKSPRASSADAASSPAPSTPLPNGAAPATYASSGVDVDAGDRMVDMIQSVMRRTHGPRVIDRPGGFAGLFRLDFNEKLFKRNFNEPVLVACTDGVGTKTKIAASINVYDTVGIDCVAMCVNDMIVEAAEPLIFLDYLGVHDLDPDRGAEIVRGVAEGCRLAGCALLGGETAEMPDVYAEGDFDLVGFSVGVVELDRAIDASKLAAGDIIIGLASSGVHSNGFTLVRKILDSADLDLEKIYPDLDKSASLGRVLLTPTRIYAKSITRLLRKYKVKKIITGMAHITGGALPGNVCRALSHDLDAVIDRSAWEPPRIFSFLQKHGAIDAEEMWRVFNMGIGYVLIVRPAFAASVKQHLKRLGETPIVIGKVERGNGTVRFTDG